MTFTEKLSRLLVDKNKSAVARRAGLSATAMTAYLAKGYMPKADNALRIARTLNVSVEWLIDDALGWPPVWKNAPEQTPAQVA